MVQATLYNRDGSVYKEVELSITFYVPPKLLIEGDTYFLRTSPDTQLDNLTYTQVDGTYHL